MKRNKIRLKSDLSFLTIILLMLVCLIFTGSSSQEKWGINVVMFCAGGIAVLIAYFYSLTAALIADLLIVFAYVSYILYGVLRTGNVVDEQLYFWIIWIPLITVAFHFFSENMNALQAKNVELNQRLEELALFDEETNLGNLYNFENNCLIYMRIAERYNMPLVLLVWELRYENEVQRLLGKKKFSEEVRAISQVSRQILREEDSLFLVGDSPHLWGTIMFTNAGGEQKVIERLKQGMEEMWQKDGTNKVKMDLRFGVAVHQEGNRTPLVLLEKAKKRLAYDVK